MKVRVELYASLREKTGVKELECELPQGSTLADLLELLKERVGMVNAEAEGLMILIDGRPAEGLGGLKALLREGCSVSIFPPIAGG
ncbi:MAG: MoaD/ThiS family protein [Candidatus Nezhaarchaeota archaeon]|nr:MoaD/ThiS family protein [Candidatus Nezhaarchaeota archaeon]